MQIYRELWFANQPYEQTHQYEQYLENPQKLEKCFIYSGRVGSGYGWVIGIESIFVTDNNGWILILSKPSRHLKVFVTWE